MPTIQVQEFNLDATLASGQCFRWKREPWKGGEWIGVIGDKAVTVRQLGDELEYKGCGDELMRNYFGLDDPIAEILESIGKDSLMSDAIAKYRGLRVLNQDPWETMISFMLSVNNSIPNIERTIERLCKAYGRELPNGHFSFPKPQLIEQATEAELRGLKMGFRAKYVKAAAEKILTHEKSLEALRGLPYDDAKARLMGFDGIADKVADCILLYGLGFDDAFPIDTWVEKAMIEDYGRKIKRTSRAKEPTYREMQSFSREYFGPYAGWAQLYLYHWKRLAKRVKPSSLPARRT
jgi:N-glycosylase/DNA lyase